MTAAIQNASHDARRPRRASRWAPLALPQFGLLLALHLLLGLGIEQPFAFPDEAGYLSHARYLGGAAPPMNLETASATYGVGYSVLIAPAFALTRDPLRAHRLITAINALLCATLVFPLVQLGRFAFSGLRRGAAWAAFVVCLYPAFLLRSNVAWAENAFVPAYAWLAVAFSAWAHVPSWRRGLGLGVIGAVLTVLHARGFVLGVVVVGLLVLLGARRHVGWRAAALPAIPILACAVLSRTGEAALSMAAGHSGRGYTVAHELSKLLRPGSASSLLHVALGQGWYVAVSSLGIVFFLLELAASRRRFWSLRPRSSRRLPLLMFLVATSSVVFVASVFQGLGGTRVDLLAYGRHNESVLAPWLMLGLLALAVRRSAGRGPPRARVAGILAAVVAALALGRQAWAWFPDGEATFAGIHVLTLLPWVWELGWAPATLALTVFAALVWVGLARAANRRRTGLLLCVPALVFLAISAYDYPFFFVRLQRDVALARPVAEALRAASVSTVAYDISHEDGFHFSLQHLLPEVRFLGYSSLRGEAPSGDAVLAPHAWTGETRVGARFLTADASRQHGVWLLGDRAGPHPPSASLCGPVLGARSAAGIWETGFGAPDWVDGRPARWVPRLAELRVPVDAASHPLTLELDLGRATPEVTAVELHVDARPVLRLPAADGLPGVHRVRVPGARTPTPLRLALRVARREEADERATWTARGRRPEVPLRSGVLLRGVTLRAGSAPRVGGTSAPSPASRFLAAEQPSPDDALAVCGVPLDRVPLPGARARPWRVPLRFAAFWR